MACFYVTISGKFERFQCFNFETDFLENENLFWKAGGTNIENASFLYKTAIWEANVKTNRLVSTKWTYHKFFWKLYFSLRTPYKKFIWCTNNANGRICTFWKCCSFIWQCFFPVSILIETHILYVSLTQSTRTVNWFQHSTV